MLLLEISLLLFRESFLPKIIEMGERVVKESKKITKNGLWGAFCLETILTPDGEIVVLKYQQEL